LNRWTETEKSFLIDNYNKISIEDISKATGKSISSIYQKAYYLELIHGSRWTESDILTLKNIYSDSSKEYIIESLNNRSWNSIKLKAERCGISRNTRDKINESFFSEYTPESCYVAGFIAADGWILSERPMVGISVMDTDEYILCEMARLMNFDGNVRNYKIKAENRHNMSTITFTSEKIIQDLCNNFNITPRKSLTIEYPTQIPNNMQKYFVLGHFDGDGGFVSRSNKKSLCVNITSTLSFLESEKSVIYNISGIDIIHNKVMLKKGSKITGTLTFEGKKALQFGEWIYYNANTFLKRKREIYDCFLPLKS